MDPKRIAVLAVAMLLAGALGFRASRHTGIQPGYFEKQEAPAYGVSRDRPLGSGMGKDVEEYFRKLYDQK
jgi:hypothetical protein